MKIIAKNLKKRLKSSGMTKHELIRRMNVLQDELYPGRRPMTVSSIYLYLKGHTPPLDKIYMLSALLDRPPQKLFTLVYDQEKLQKITNLIQQKWPT